ncbi:MAG: hypothetical protein J5685_10185 [Clostridiales bacterium]|nr:hypothetical protein [Clostridiales bacterium]
MKENIRSIAGALCLAVIYVSSVYLIDAISYNSEVWAMIYALFIAVAYCLTLISPDKKRWLLKYLLSIPLSFGVNMYFVMTDYSLRALNRAIPDYGRPSAGGNMAGFIRLMSFSVLCLVALIVSLFFKPRKGKTFGKFQNAACIAVTVAVVAAVLILQSQFPDKILALEG